MNLLKEELRGILRSGAFSKLRPYRSAKKWQAMSEEEKELLGLLFIKQGEKFLSKGDVRADESFDLASRVLPGDYRVFFSQALALSEQVEMSHLEAASVALERSTTLNEDHFEAWSLWAKVLLKMGVYYREEEYLSKSDEKFLEAEAFAVSSMNLSQFYWEWGLCWFQMGRLSGEMHDFKRSEDLFEKAIVYGADDANFWNDYGNVLTESYTLLDSTDILTDAIDCYKKAVQATPLYFEAWFNLGAGLQSLYEKSLQLEQREAAAECYKNATMIEPKNGSVWAKWGQLLSWSGKTEHSFELVEESIDKFAQANSFKAHHPVILASWGEACLVVGTHKNDLELLRTAQEKLASSLETFANNPDVWCLYGECFTQIGRYFDDATYLYQAIEKYKQGLHLNRAHYMLWFGLGLTYLALGEIREEKATYEKAILFFSRVLEFCKEAPPLFWCHWGTAFYRLAQLTQDRRYIESAIDKFEKAVQMIPEGDSMNSELIYAYASSLELMGDHDEDCEQFERAIQLFDKILENDPNHWSAHYHVAMCYSQLAELTTDMGHFEQANVHFETATQLEPEDGSVWNDWGFTLLNIGVLQDEPANPEKAEPLFAEAEDRFRHAAALGNEQAYYHLSCLFSLKQETKAALHYLERACRVASLPSLDHLMEDEWLHNLRATTEFQQFFDRLL